MIQKIAIEKSGKIKNIYTARVLGVVGASLSSGLDMMSNGVKYSNVSGLVIGAAAGYYAGKASDAAVIALNLLTGKDNSGVIPGVLCAGIGYGISSGFTSLGRRFDEGVEAKVDDVTDWYQNRNTPVDTTASDAVNLF